MSETSAPKPSIARANSSVLHDGIPYFTACTQRIQNGESLSVEEANRMMTAIVGGLIPDENIEEYLVLLAEKGEAVEEIVGSAQALRAHALPFYAAGEAIDNCGTGGDGAGTFNISTIAALVVAGTGQSVVKHGNRSASGRVGSADLMEALGVKIDFDPKVALISHRRFNFAFLFAPQYHPAAKAVAPIRKRLGRPTIFNLMGPLCNPAAPPYQLLGVPGRAIAEKISEAVLRLRVKRAFVVTGNAGVDELIPEGCNDVYVVEKKRITHTTLSAQDAGLEECSLGDLQGGDVNRNAAIAMSILEGVTGSQRDAVLFNAGAALLCTGAAESLAEACRRCERAIDDRAALRLLDDLRAFSQHGVVRDE